MKLLKPKEKAAIDGKPSKNLVLGLTRVFNRFIRFRDTPGGFGRCVSCKKPISRERCHASHYIPGDKRYWGTKWDERNVHGSCVHCNAFLEGNKGPYKERLIQVYGSNIEEELKLQNKLHPRCPSNIELQMKIKHYTEKIKEVQ